MSKGSALALATVCGMLAIVLFGVNAPGCGVPVCMVALVGGVVWLRKFSRDQRTAEVSRPLAQESPARLPEPPAMSSPESARLFVPEPLNERQ